MTQPVDTLRLLEEKVEELQSQLALSRAANKANWRRFVRAQKVIYDCFRWMDTSLDDEQLVSLNEHYDWYKEGCDLIGWNYDWDARVEAHKPIVEE